MTHMTTAFTPPVRTCHHNRGQGRCQRLRQWTSEEIIGDVEKDFFARTERLQSSKSSFNPTAETLDEFPAVTMEKLKEWELEKESDRAPFGQRMAFKAFNLVFPPEAVNLFVNKVSGHDLGRFKERIVVGS